MQLNLKPNFMLKKLKTISLLSVIVLGTFFLSRMPVALAAPAPVRTVVSTTANKAVLTSAQIATKAANSTVEIDVYKNMPTYSLQLDIIGNRLVLSRHYDGNDARMVASGSGFFITADGYIMTNNHVVEDSDATYMVSYNGNDTIPASVIYRNADEDLAVLKIAGSKYPIMPLGNSSQISVGDKVIALGNAYGQYTNYATQGSVTALNQSLRARDGNSYEDLSGTIQSNARIYPGESGGPLLNANGEIIAINTATADGRGPAQSFFVPINKAKEIISLLGIA